DPHQHAPPGRPRHRRDQRDRGGLRSGPLHRDRRPPHRPRRGGAGAAGRGTGRARAPRGNRGGRPGDGCGARRGGRAGGGLRRGPADRQRRSRAVRRLPPGERSVAARDGVRERHGAGGAVAAVAAGDDPARGGRAAPGGARHRVQQRRVRAGAPPRRLRGQQGLRPLLGGGAFGGAGRGAGGRAGALPDGDPHQVRGAVRLRGRQPAGGRRPRRRRGGGFARPRAGADPRARAVERPAPERAGLRQGRRGPDPRLGAAAPV
ncbi:MAG: 3-oxoacyl-[acyl-carrier protein] reductase, partial [uncultured Acetobacteraceae bacterium]